MTVNNPFAWLVNTAEVHYRREQPASPKPRLTLITTDSPLIKTRKLKMNTQQDYEAKSAELIYRRYSCGLPIDHISMVHNALNAVRDLALPSGNGRHPNGAEEDFESLGRNSFVDLIEILNDRLGMALELHELRYAQTHGDDQ